LFSYALKKQMMLSLGFSREANLFVSACSSLVHDAYICAFPSIASYD